jgi:hypothetical protein
MTGTLSGLRLSAIARSDSPRARWRCIRRTIACRMMGGWPSLTPLD